jgi:hypothetical protein
MANRPEAGKKTALPHETVYNPVIEIVETRFQGSTFIEGLRELIKRAAVQVDNSQGARFAEIASANRWQRFRFFATLEEARSWLKEEP